jgi:hypothetical protein
MHPSLIHPRRRPPQPRAHGPGSARRRRSRPTASVALPGRLLKRLLVGFWAVYLSLVALTNLVNLLDAFGVLHWTFLNSGNFAYLRSVVRVYDIGPLLTQGLLTGAVLIETAGAALAWRAVRSGDVNHALQALCGTAAIWLAFIFMTEVFVAYRSEPVFRELLLLTMTTAVCIAVCPDRVTWERSPQ